MIFRSYVLAALLLAVAVPANAAPVPEALALFAKDVAGASDHPLVGRYVGSVILGKTQKAFDEITLPSGPAVGASYAVDKKFSATVTAQGVVTRFIYIAPQGRSSLEVSANFIESIAAKGYEPVFRCAGEACGESFMLLKYRWDKPETKVLGTNYDHARKSMIDAAFDQLVELRYGLFKKTTADGDSYIAVYAGVHRNGGFGDYSAALADRTGILLEVVEPKAMKKKMVVVSADEIGGNLATQGKALFYGIQFDFDKADIKAESEPQLAEMAKFMKANPQLRAFDRADSVVKALVTRYGVDGKRMSARGLGPLSPVATNRTEDGQSKNRRVELVEQ